MHHVKSCDGRLVVLTSEADTPSEGCGEGIAYPRMTAGPTEAVVFGGLAFGTGKGDEAQGAGQRVDIAPHVRRMGERERQFRVNIRAGSTALRFTAAGNVFTAARNGDPFTPHGVMIAGWSVAASADRARIVMSRGNERIWLVNVGGELTIEVVIEETHALLYGAWAAPLLREPLPPDWGAGFVLVRYTLE